MASGLKSWRHSMDRERVSSPSKYENCGLGKDYPKISVINTQIA